MKLSKSFWISFVLLAAFTTLATWLLIDQFRPHGGVYIAKELLQPERKP